MAILFCGIAIASCSKDTEKRFELLAPQDTGIDFVNELNPTPELNIFSYLYFYDGGGVAAGDLSGNGLPDLFFTSSQGQNRLYLNRGDFRFEDVTDLAFDKKSADWTTGVTLVDINDSGLLDIYVSNVAGYSGMEGRNELFINLGTDEDGIPRFEERAEKFGLDLKGFSTQAVFFDYDLDEDLDLFMMNHSVHSLGTFTYSDLRYETHPLAGDRLLRNDNGSFTDVTDESGIHSSALGYGLGIGISDFSQNGYPDIYIGNDFHEDDYLYLNNGDGTFTESLGEMIRHTSYSSMGNDLVDINNNGLVDIISLDMLPEEYEKQKTSAGEDTREIYNLKRQYGYKDKYSRNTLQLNRGNGRFSEIGMLAGIHATDWSWAALGADFNNSGRTDLFISNGIKHRTDNLDYIDFITRDSIQVRLRGELTEEDLRLAEYAPEVKIPNYLYRNTGSLTFEDVSASWGLTQQTLSSGAVYADLNNDGDLDIVTNNVNQHASVFRNMTRERFPDSNFLKVGFRGPEGNRFGIGAKITVPLNKGQKIVRELYPSRGFQSSVDFTLHIGIGTLQVIPELQVQWPDGSSQVLRNTAANQTLIVDYSDSESSPRAVTGRPEKSSSTEVLLLEEITTDLGVSFKHQENEFNEFNREALIPHMVSREGPALAVGDVTNNGLEDFFIGGAKRQPGALYVQLPDGTFEEKIIPAFQEDYIHEDVDAHIADFTGDGNSDLLIVSGGNEYAGNSEYMLPRLYINDGEGNLSRDRERLPDIFITGSVAAVADVSRNGYPDIFLGARAVPWNYGVRPVSYLLINQGDGSFKTDTTEYGSRFSDAGLVTGAEWADMNGDGNPDLVVASEWADLKIIYHDPEQGKYEIPNSSGLWNTLSIADLDNSGTPDILAGNLGLNSRFRASDRSPLRMYVNDFDGNGTMEQVITYVDRDGSERLFATRDELAEQMPSIMDRFETYQSFAEADLHDVIDRRLLNNSIEYSVNELRSSIFYNREDGFRKSPLPVTCQFAPIHDFLVLDLNSNGSSDIISAGNFYDATSQRGRYDADYGNVLINSGDGIFHQFPNREIDWYLDGQIKRVETIRISDDLVMIVAENDGSPQFYRINRLTPDAFPVFARE